MTDYRAPDEIHYLLLKWGRCLMMGAPMKYPTCAPGFQDYYPVGGEKEEPAPFDIQEFDKLCGIIDSDLNQREVEALKCKYGRYKSNGKQLNRRQSAAQMRMYVSDYLALVEYTLKKVVRLFDE